MHRTKLLIVDDDEYVLRLFEQTLAWRYDVVTTNNPAVLTEMVRYERPDAVLCDINMPEMTGAQAVRGLADDEDLREVPVIYFTDLVAQNAVEKNGGVLGGRPAVSKSAPINEFVATIERVLAH